MKEKEYGSINNVLFRSPVNKWFKQNLTYSIVNYTNDLPRVSVHLVIARAFKYWEDVTPLKFHAWRNSTADILIKLVKYKTNCTGYQGSDNPVSSFFKNRFCNRKSSTIFPLMQNCLLLYQCITSKTNLREWIHVLYKKDTSLSFPFFFNYHKHPTLCCLATLF